LDRWFADFISVFFPAPRAAPQGAKLLDEKRGTASN
jgi:hypothetical protein